MALLPLAIVVVVIVVVASRRRSPGVTFARSPGPDPDASARARLDRWVDAGLLSQDQRSSILAYEAERSAAPASAGWPSVTQDRIVEALGYLGAVLAAVGVGLLVGRYWDDLSGGVRLGLAGGVTVVLTAAGFALRREGSGPLERLRGVVWATGSAAAGLAAFVAVTDLADVHRSARVAALVAGAAALHSGVLWRGRPRPLQQAGALGAGLVGIGAGVGSVSSTGSAGLVVWAVGAAVVGAALARAWAQPPVAALVGGAGAAVGALTVADDWIGVGLALAVATGVALAGPALVVGERPWDDQRLPLGLVAGFALLFGGPQAVGYFADQAGLATGAVVWLGGAAVAWLAASGRLRHDGAMEAAGVALLLGGAAITAAQHAGVGPLAGLATAGGLLAVGTRPGRVRESVGGIVGLSINVPWATTHWFPERGQAAAAVLLTGLVILVASVWWARRERSGPAPGGLE